MHRLRGRRRDAYGYEDMVHCADNSPDEDDEDLEVTRMKVRSISHHYNSLLTSQLQEQYAYFEDKLAALQAQLASRAEALGQEQQVWVS